MIDIIRNIHLDVIKETDNFLNKLILINKMKKKIALIFGITGQDGSYLAKFLIKKNYSVIGITRNKSSKNTYRLNILNIIKDVKLIKCPFISVKFLDDLLKKNKHICEIYYLAGESSPIESFINPENAIKSNTIGVLNILLSIKKIKKKIKLFNASSVQIFGNNKSNFYNENSKISPTTPYAVSKASGYWLTKIFRENYNLYSCSGILFNHESVLRDDRFVSKKIINFTKKYKKNNKIKLRMGNLDIYRDWGWAPEYVEAMWLMLQQKKPIDLIIGTGKKHSLREFVNVVFKKMKINKKNLVERSSKLIRKIDINSYRANTNLCKKTIKWEAKISFKEIIYKMLKEEIY